MGPSVWVLGLLLGIWPQFGEDPLEASFPLEAKGDIHFQVDAIVFHENGAPAIEVDLVLPTASIGDPQHPDTTEIEFVVEMLDRDAQPRAAYRTVMVMPPDTTGVVPGGFPIPTRWVRLHPKWIEGTVGLRVTASDLSRLKVGFLDKVRGKHRSGQAAARLTRSERTESALLGGPLFAWGQAPPDRVASGPGLRSVRSRLQPNPHRYYGLYQPVLSVYWERYPVPEALGVSLGDSLRVSRTIVQLPDERRVFGETQTVLAESLPRWDLARVDVSDLATGAYRFEVSLSDLRGGAQLDRASGRFQVLWERSRWLVDTADLLSIGRVLFRSDVYDSFATLGRGDQEAFLRQFWSQRSPTAPGQSNELEQRFFERVLFANKEFKSYRPGMETDQGRVFIRYGSPDEVTFNLNPQDLEVLSVILPKEIDEFGLSDDEKLRRTRTRSPVDNRAYEIWEYHVRGDPLLPEYAPPGMETGLKFIFVDELGYGDYSLIYTSIAGGLQ